MNKLSVFRKSDFIIIGVCLLLAALIFVSGFFSKSGELTAVIKADGEVVREIILDEKTDETIEINDVIIICKGKSVCVSESTCEDKICVRTGELDYPGASCVCVPNRVSVYIDGKDKDIDAMAY